MLRALLLATAIAALFGSAAIRDCTQDLPEGRCFHVARAAAATWDGAMQSAGLGWAYQWLHLAVRD